MKEFYRRITSNKSLFAKLLVASFLVNILALATPIYVIQVLQRYVAYGVVSTLVTLVVGICFIVIFEFFFRNIRHRMAREYELQNVLIANSILNKLTSIKSHIYETGQKLRNDLINKNLSIIQNVYTASGILVLIDVPFTLIFLLALFLIHYQLGIIAIIFLLIPFLIIRYYKEKLGNLSSQSDANNGNLFRIFDNVITRNITLKFFDLLKPITASWNIVANRIANNREDLESEKNVISSFSSGLGSLLTVVIIGWGATLAVDGQITVGALIGANILAARALMPIIRFTQMQESIFKGESASIEISKFLGMNSDENSGREIKEFTGSAIFSDLQFTYPSKKNPMFENLSFEASSGDIVSISGNNGSGKSTLIKVIINVLELNRGQILIDQIDLNQLSINWYRDQISYSPQEPTFIDGTLGDNIIGSNQIESSELTNTLRDVDLLNYINSHESGINMVLDNRGEDLPLGIRRRISLARSIIGNGMIVVFDEPTEGLDKVGKDAVYKLIKKLKDSKKTIFIASNDENILTMANITIDLNIKPKPSVKKVKNV